MTNQKTQKTQILTIAAALQQNKVDTIAESIGEVSDVLTQSQTMSEVNSSNLITSVDEIRKSIDESFESLAGNKLQEEENRRELIDALKKKEEKDKAVKQPSSAISKDNTLGLGWYGAIAAGIGASIGSIFGFLSEFGLSIKGIAKMLKPISTFTAELVSGAWAKIVGTISKALSGLSNLFGKSKIGSLFDDLYKPIKNLFTFIRRTSGIGAQISGFGKFVMSFLEIFSGLFTKLTQGLRWGFKFGSLIGQIVKKLAYPIVIVMSIWDAVTGAIDGFKKDGIMGAFKGGLSKFIVGVAGSIVDLVKDGISWVANFFGFTEVSKMLDSFSFSALMTTGVEGIVDFVKYLWDWFAGMFNPTIIEDAWDRAGFAGIGITVVSLIGEMIKNAISWIAELFGFTDISTALDRFDFRTTMLGWLDKFSKMIENFAGDVTTFFLTLPERVTSAVNGIWDNAQVVLGNVFDAIFGVFDKIKGWVNDKIGWLIGSNETGEQLSDEDKKAKANKAGFKDWSAYEASGFAFKETGGKGYKVPFEEMSPDEKGRAAGHKDWKSYEASGWKWLAPKESTDTAAQIQPNASASQIQASPSSSGATLTEAASNATINAPVIINQMGGNVTNTNTSSVNNNSTPFEPIITGSSMGFA